MKPGRSYTQRIGSGSPLTTIQITRAADVLPEEEVAALQPTIDEIERLKRERNAIVAARNYMTPDIYHLAADITGDSLALAHLALETEADVIVLAGVHFMAETAKLIAPEKTILIPDLHAGVLRWPTGSPAPTSRLRREHPGRPGGELRQHVRRCEGRVGHHLHLGNAVAVVESARGRQGDLHAGPVPGELGGARRPTSRSILWEGSCMVHDRFTGQEIRDYRRGTGPISR